MDRIPKAGEFYRHFKNRLYQVITVAEDSETGESMVVYQALYGDYRTYVRPLVMFTSKVDSVKYPEVSQIYRFEQVSVKPETEEERDSNQQEEPEIELSPNLISFIEAETYEQKLEYLAMMRGKIGQDEMNIIYGCMDMKETPGELENQMDAVEQYLLVQKRFERGRRR